MSTRKPNKNAMIALFLLAAQIQSSIAHRIFSSKMGLGSQTMNFRPMYNDAAKIQQQYRRRMDYLAKHGKHARRSY